MKNYSALFLLLLSFSGLFAQNPNYSRVKVHCTPLQFRNIAEAGVAVDHIHFVDQGTFMGEFSDYELGLIEESGANYTTVIADLEEYYAHQNDNRNPQKASGISANTPSNFNYGSMGGYLTWTEAKAELDSMALLYPNLITAPDSIGASLEGRPIWLVKMSDNPLVDENEPEVLYDALHHAREPGSLMQMIYFMWYMLENYGTDPLVTDLINNRELYFVPVVNPDGYVYNETTNPNGGGMWRKNRRQNVGGSFGVDLNRNYGYEWGHDNTGSSPDPNSDVYRGTSGFSEPETQVMKTLCENREFRLAFNYHTYGNLLIYPWGFSDSHTPDSAYFEGIAELLTAENNYTYGTGTETVGYVVNGDSDDWMYGEQSTKDKIYSMTPEAGDAFLGFWPPQSQILRICEENLEANIQLACLAGECIIPFEQDEPPITGTSYFFPVDFQNLGLDTTGMASATLTPISGGILSVNNNPRSLPQLSNLAIHPDSFDLTLSGSLQQGDVLEGELAITYANGYVQTDTISFVYGSPITVFTTDGENGTDGWTGGWLRTDEKAYSGSYSLTDSRFNNYNSNDNNPYTSPDIDLTGINTPWLQFQATWDIEDQYDFVQVLISENGGSWVPLAGQHTVAGNGWSAQPSGEPGYDGVQNGWVLETMDLSAYAGSTVKLRFLLLSDSYVEEDGFYFDDLEVLGYGSISSREDEFVLNEQTFLYPNPGGSQVFLQSPADRNVQGVRILSLLGQDLGLKIPDQNGSVDLGDLAPGLYLYQVEPVLPGESVRKFRVTR